MNKECAGRNDAPGIGGQWTPLPILRLNGRMRQELAIDGNLIAVDGYKLSRQSHNGFDERCYPAITETRGKIEAFASRFDFWRIGRRTDKHCIADTNVTGQGFNLPKSKRNTGCCVDPVATKDTGCGNPANDQSGK